MAATSHFLSLITIAYLVTMLQINTNAQTTVQSTNLDCTFDEVNLCKWSQDENKDLQWRYFNTTIGDFFIYVDSASADQTNKRITLTSLLVNPGQPKCLSFSYNMFGVRVNELNLYVRSSSSNKLIWQRIGSQDNVWRRGYRTIKSYFNYTLQFEAVTTQLGNGALNTGGTIAINDIQFTNGICPSAIQYADYTCDFEENLCFWKSDEKAIWEESRGVETSRPRTDHTTGTDNGYFAHVPRGVSYGILQSSKFDPLKKGRCLRLSYFLERIGDATIEVSLLVEEKNLTLLRSLIGTEDNQWSTSQIFIPSSQSHQIIIRGKKNNDAAAVIAIDDTIISETDCDDQPPMCTFQLNFCDWSNYVLDAKNDVIWLRSISGKAPVYPMKLPPYDATETDAGYFLFVDIDNTQENSKATLKSTLVEFCPHACFQLKYWTHGINFGELQVLINNFKGERLIWSTRNETRNNKWEDITLLVDCIIKPYEILVRAVAGANDGYIAIDNLNLMEGHCDSTDPIIHPTFEIPLETETTRNNGPTTEEISVATGINTISTERSVTEKPTSYSVPGDAKTTTGKAEITTNARTTTAKIPTTLKPHCVSGKWDCGDVFHTCVFSIYRCDGIKDCPNNADEANCDFNFCKRPNMIICHNPNNRSCIFENNLCDDVRNCADNSDEAEELCRSCPKDLCLHDGECKRAVRQPYCSCQKKRYSGRRCEIDHYYPTEKSPVLIENHKEIVWITVPLMSFLVVIIGILLVNLYCRRKYAWYHAAGIFQTRRHNRLYDRNSMDRTGDNAETDDDGQGTCRRRSRDEPLSIIRSPLLDMKNQLFLGAIVLDADGNIVNISSRA